MPNSLWTLRTLKTLSTFHLRIFLILILFDRSLANNIELMHVFTNLSDLSMLSSLEQMYPIQSYLRRCFALTILRYILLNYVQAS